jgi:hypothetical protein
MRDGCLQLDILPLTLHQALCGAVDARDHRVAESRYAVAARPGRLSALTKPAAACLLTILIAADACGTGAGWQQ